MNEFTQNDTLDRNLSIMASIISSFCTKTSRDVTSHTFDRKSLEYARAATEIFKVKPAAYWSHVDSLQDIDNLHPGFRYVTQNVAAELKPFA